MGKIEIDHTGSGGGITLSSDGTDLLLDGTAIGGGGTVDTTSLNTDTSETIRYLTFVDSSAATGQEVRTSSAFTIISNSTSATGEQTLKVGSTAAGNRSVIEINGNNNGGSAWPELIFYDSDSAASLGQGMGRITFQNADSGSNGLARIEASVLGGQDPNDGARIAFLTKNSSGVYAERLRITETGSVQIHEAYTLPVADGTVGQVLTTDGSGAVTFADAGAALELYAENPVSPTAPSATGDNAVAIGSGSISAATNSIAINTGDALYGVIAGATNGIAIGYQARVRANVVNSLAIGFSTDVNNTQSTAVGYNAFAGGINSQAFGSGAYSGNDRALALGYNTNAGTTGSTALGSNSGSQGSVTATGSGAMALGGSYASGTDSFAAAIGNNTSSYGATGANSIAMGSQSKATSFYSIAIGWLNTAGNRSIAIGGQGSTAGDNSVCVGTWQSNITNAYSAAVGGGKASDRGVQNRWAYGLVSAPAVGAAQAGLHVEYAQTSDATPTVLKTNSSPVNFQNQVILPNNSAYAFHGTIVARQQASQGTACAAWKIEGLIRREGSAGTTVLVNSATTVLDNTPAWGMDLSADTSNGGLAITVTGAAATNIRWVASINTSEVTY